VLDCPMVDGDTRVEGSLDAVIEAYKKDVDRTLLRERLKLSVEERLIDLMRMQAIAAELREAGRPLTR
jgi:hypothetical protein